jgi:hypothetical protein
MNVWEEEYRIGSLYFRYCGRFSIYPVIPDTFKAAFIMGQLDRFRDREIKLLPYKREEV